MSIKRMVSTAFWQDPIVLDHYTVEEQQFFLYLLTNPRSKLCGIYLLPKRYISFEAKHTRETADKLLKQFQNVYKNIIYNHETQEVAVLNALKYGIVSGGPVVENLIRKELTIIKDTNLILAVYHNMRDFWSTQTARQIDQQIKTIFEEELETRKTQSNNDNEYVDEYVYEYVYEVSTDDTGHESIDESSNESVVESEKKQLSAEKTKKQLEEEKHSANFERFWKIYPKRVAGKKAKDIWLKKKYDDLLTEKIIEAITQQVAITWKNTEKQFIPNATTWLNQQRWEDEIIKAPPPQNDRRTPAQAERERIKDPSEYEHETNANSYARAWYEKQQALAAQGGEDHA